MCREELKKTIKNTIIKQREIVFDVDSPIYIMPRYTLEAASNL